MAAQWEVRVVIPVVISIGALIFSVLTYFKTWDRDDETREMAIMARHLDLFRELEKHIDEIEGLIAEADSGSKFMFQDVRDSLVDLQSKLTRATDWSGRATRKSRRSLEGTYMSMIFQAQKVAEVKRNYRWCKQRIAELDDKTLQTNELLRCTTMCREPPQLKLLKLARYHQPRA